MIRFECWHMDCGVPGDACDPACADRARGLTCRHQWTPMALAPHEVTAHQKQGHDVREVGGRG